MSLLLLLAKIAKLGPDILDGWDFTSGWIGNATIDSSNSFTSVGAQYIRLDIRSDLVEGKKYQIHIVGTTTSVACNITDYNISGVYGAFSGVFDETIIFISNANGGIGLNNATSGTTTITSMTIKEVL